MALRLFYYGFKVVENKKRACLLYDTPSLKRYFMIFIFAISISSLALVWVRALLRLSCVVLFTLLP